MCFETPAIMIPTPHRDTLHRVCVLPDQSYVTASMDGVVAFWNPTTLQLKRQRMVSSETMLLYLRLEPTFSKPGWLCADM